jgi:hypothetical protein
MKIFLLLRTTALCWILAGSALASETSNVKADFRQSLLHGVSTIARPGSPGPIAVAAAGNATIVAGEADPRVLHPVVVAGTIGRGRVVVFGHDGYLNAETIGVADTARLLQNAFNFTAGGTRPTQVLLRGGQGLRRFLDAQGIRWTGVPRDSASLPNPVGKVLVLDQSPLSDSQLHAISEFVSDGGGLICAGLGWGWLQLNPGKSLAEHPLNRLLAPMGVAIADGILGPTSAGNTFAAQLDTAARLPMDGHEALDHILRQDPLGQSTSKLSNPINKQAIASLTLATRFNFDARSTLRIRLRAILDEHRAKLSPIPAGSSRATSLLTRALNAFQAGEIEYLAAQAPNELVSWPRLPGVEVFPGQVPAWAPRIDRKFSLQHAPGWQSLGLYAPPGDLITVTVPPQAPSGWKVQIGAHTDQLWHLDLWRRYPIVTIAIALRPGENRFASPFGGLIYLIPPESKTSPMDLMIKGAVESPRYVLGTDSKESWSRSKVAPGPWAELASEKLILTIPASVAASIEDPSELMTFWNLVMDAMADLATIPRERARPERIVADEQISIGYMHSGYPIMTHLDAAQHMVNLPDLKIGKNAWGLFHELGHNHQSQDWTFEGAGEVTVNLFTLYALQTVSRLPKGDPGIQALVGSQPIIDYFASGRSFAKWKGDPFLALRMYEQLRVEFGWDAFKKVFAEYRSLPTSERPKNDADKRDQWMVRFSLAVGRNLAAFFERWGIPISDKAKVKTQHLESWLPQH